MKRKGRKHGAAIWSALLLLMLLFGSQAGAQVTTASIGGTVADKTGPLPGATVSAKNTQSAFVYKATAGDDGSFQLNGLPPGTYEITVSSEAYKPQIQTVTVLLAQQNKVRFELSPEMVVIADTTVVGETTKLLVDTRSPAVTTNITTQQIQNLPQNNRNFLAFAALAPGVGYTYDTDAAGQGFRSGGANPSQVNVFIDGLSYKNDIIKGGAFMQDSSRGNPFPQGAVQEYQVLTQNYKAEYEKAAAAVITAVTKSGGNAFHGDAFYLYQNKSMVEQDEFAKARGDKKAPYKRNQYGLSLGGPIIQDKLHFFVTAEVNDRDVVSSVFHGSSWDSPKVPASVKAILDPYQTGSVSAPFKEKLYFGKLTWQPSVSQTADFSYNRRDENELRGFGGQRTKDGAESFDVKTDAAVLKYQLIATNNMLNEASLTWQKLQWINGAVNPSMPHENYRNLLDIGSKDYIQDLSQQTTGVRDHVTYFGEWHGTHTLKGGVTANFMKYDFMKAAFFIPYFEFRENETWQFPFLARYGFGNPSLNFSNTQYGVFVQDDWMLARNFTVNVGLRWDYETNMHNNNWVTPPGVVLGLQNTCKTFSVPVGGKDTWCIRDFLDINNYISTGSNRSSYKNMFQPRLGFTWDPKGNGQTVVFGGWGQYYDRVVLNDIYDEQFRHSWSQYTFCFSADGGPVQDCGGPPIKWDPSYLSAAGLNKLIASGQTGGPEVFLLANDLRPPRSTQWTFGVRQQFGSWLTSLTYANSRGYNGLVWSIFDPPGVTFEKRWDYRIGIPANPPYPGYGSLLKSYNLRKTWYDGYFLTFDRPYAADSKWGVNIAYTYSKAYQNASLDEGTAFTFDDLAPNFPRFPGNADERHRLVASGTVGLPAGFLVSSIITLGSGLPFSYTNCLAGWDKCVYYRNGGQPPKQSFLGIKEFGYRSMDLRVEWDAHLGGDLRLGLTGEAFNVLNYANDGCFDGWAGAPGEPNAHFGKGNCQFNTRRYQIGARFTF